MCGRFAFFSPSEAVLRVFDLGDMPEMKARYNVAPTQQVPVVRSDETNHRTLETMRWGLIPFWAKDTKIGNRLINARSETLTEKPSFRTAYKKRRCLVVASGFYEWMKTDDGKQPYLIARPDGDPFGMAGLWESWRDKEAPEDADPLLSCTIITKNANESIAEVHHRMPAILNPDDFETWLDPKEADAARLGDVLDRAGKAVMTFRPISKAVNSPKNEGKDLIEPIA